MKKLISAKLAGNILLAFFGFLAFFHVLVLLRVVPADIVWGGQIGDSAANLFTLEMIALVSIILFAVVIAAKMDYIHAAKYSKAVTLGLWFIFAYLLLNLAGNLASGVSFENLVFAPLTLVMAVMMLRLAIEK